MNRKIVWLGFTTVLLMSTVFGTIWSRGSITLASPRTWLVDDDGKDCLADTGRDPDFHTIRKALKYALPGDTILVYPGPYIDETLSIKTPSLNLTGKARPRKDRTNTTLVFPEIEIVTPAEDVTISNLKVEHGIIKVAANRTTISNSDISQTETGVKIGVDVEEINIAGNAMHKVTKGISSATRVHVHKSVFRNNSISGWWPEPDSKERNMSIGINIWTGTDNLITENHITRCQHAMQIGDTPDGTSNGNQIINNTIVNCDYGIHTSSENDSIRDNVIRNCTRHSGIGIICSNSNHTNIKNNTLQTVLHGIQLQNAHQCTIQNNNLTHISHDCIYLSYTNQCIVRNNFFYNGSSVGGSAIFLSNSNFTTIKENTIYKCGHHGLHVYEGCNNYTVYHNAFFENGFSVNGIQAVDQAGTGHFDNSTLEEGNYWSDYEGEDNDGDGKGDTKIPHQIPHYEDRYPLVLPWRARALIPINYTVVHDNFIYLQKPHEEEIICCCNVSGECITISKFNFDKKEKSISFGMTVGNKTCHCNITVPKQLLGGVFEVYVEDTAVPYIINSNQNCYFIYFDRTCFAFSEHSTYNIRIIAETAIPLTGDINNDGVVDMFDISELLKTFGDKS